MPAPSRLVLTAAVAVVFLAGCAPQVGDAQVDQSPSPTLTPIVEPLKLQGLQVGTPLTSAQAKELNGMRGTLRPYEMSDGSFIVLDVKKSLPEPVMQEVVASIGESDSSDLGAFFRKTDEASAKTGKTLIVVRYMSASTKEGEPLTAWMASSAATSFPGFNGGSAEDVAVQARAWADEQRDPAQMEVIIVPN